MLVVKEMLYFMFALILLCVLMCLLIWCGWLMNTLCKELLDVDVIAILRTMSKERKLKKIKIEPPTNLEWDYRMTKEANERRKNEGKNI